VELKLTGAKVKRKSLNWINHTNVELKLGKAAIEGVKAVGD